MNATLESAKANFIAGDLDRAEREARTVRRAAKEAGDLEGAGRARSLLAEVAYDRLRYVQARDELKRAISELTEVLPDTHVAVRQARASLAIVLGCMEDDEAAAAQLDLAKEGRADPTPPLDVEDAQLWITIAVGLESQKQPRARRILEILTGGALDAALPGAVPALATAHLHLASIVERAGEQALALRLEERCVELRTQAFGPENIRVAAARFGLARLQIAANRIEDARANALEAMALLHRLGAAREPRMSTAHCTLGVAELMSGNVEQGTKHLETACAIEEKTFGSSNPQTAGMLSMLVQVHAGRGNWGKVTALCGRILPVLREAPSQQDSYALSCELGATALLAQGKPRDAVRELRAGLAHLERGHTLGAERFARLWALLGRCELTCGHADRAADAFERARASAAEAGDGELVAHLGRELEHVRAGGGARLKGQS